MNWKRTLGLDNLTEDYAFARDESTGYTSAKKFQIIGYPPPAAIAQ